MANPFQVQGLDSLKVVNPLESLMMGQQAYGDSRKSAQAERQRSMLAQLMGGGGSAAGGGPDYAKAASALAAGGDLDGAVKIATLGKAFAPENTADIQNYNFAVSKGYKGSPLEFAKEKAAAGATRVSTNNTVNTGGGSDKQIFDTVDESAKAARAAATGLQGIKEARNALNANGGAITGFGANQKLGLQKIGAALGVADPAKIENTETFRSAIAPQVAAMLKATVGTANISNSDREFAEKAAGGNITLEAGTINRLLTIMERAGNGIVKQHSDRLNTVYPDKKKFSREHALFSVNGGPVRVQSPQDAMKLPPGTSILLPDGTEGVVPGG